MKERKSSLGKWILGAVLATAVAAGVGVVSDINSNHRIHFDGNGNIRYKDFRCRPVKQRAIEYQGVDALVNAANDNKFERSRLQRLRPLAYLLENITSNTSYDELFRLNGEVRATIRSYSPIAGKTYPAPKCKVIRN
jgi:hypothetical protein